MNSTESAKKRPSGKRPKKGSFTVKKSQKLQCAAALEEVTLTNSSDIIISGDGTWKTRGYSSRWCVCAIIGDKTGKCIDAEVMSSLCKGCDSWKRRRSPAYKKWKILHVKRMFEEPQWFSWHDGDCGNGSYISAFIKSSFCEIYILHRDGDSKTFSSITASNPYGEDITVSKN
ncbi:uncharacterized protein TNCV_3010161 [Trichonephila clavipes]|nr:uncharacterized protein TNCV_3010161 [Trichonephila clavipes]